MQREYRLTFQNPVFDEPFQQHLAMLHGFQLAPSLSLRDVFEWLDAAYAELPQAVDGDALEWTIHELLEGSIVRETRETLTADLWEAYCEDFAAFRMWLDCFGWGVVYVS